jgi:phospholipid/cholesterol/gamma-HCH transport system ATP-binding protein
MIRIVQLQKRFAGSPVLTGVNLEIQDGETLVIIGRSGGGKSVLLKHLCGLLKPDAGEVWVDDVETVALAERDMPAVRRKFGFLFQGAALFDSLTLFENVAFPLREQRNLPETEIAQRVNQALEIVGLAGAGAKKPAELSGGMRKRAGLARAAVGTPKYLLYDEPTTGLDPVRADTINNLILRMRDHYHVTGVAVTHDMASAYKIADRIAMLHNGQIHTVGTPAEIQASADPIVQQFIRGIAEETQEVKREFATQR